MNELNNCYYDAPGADFHPSRRNELPLDDEDFIEEGEDLDSLLEEKTSAEPEPKPEKSENASYQLIKSTKLGEGEAPLGNVIGHEAQKKELLAVVDWFNRSKELKSKGVSIPRGVILYGQPGNGKSLLIKEMIRCCSAPVFVFQGGCANVAEGIYETFAKAREAGHAIIVFDELDLLINKERRVIRALQENLDGVESDDDILVLSATNDINQIPDALLRNGRLEKLVEIPYADGKEAIELLKKYFKEFGLQFPADFDEEETGLLLNHVSCAGMKAVVNDLILRNGFENITCEMIDNSINNIIHREISAPEEDNIEVAVHEAGHAIMAHNYPQFFQINRLHISGASGEFCAKEVERGFWPYEKIVADIKISMGGIIAQKVVFGRASRGCEEDLQRARSEAYNLFNIAGYSSCWETLPVLRPYARVDTPLKRRKMEKKIERFLRKCEKETTRYVKAHRAQIEKLGKLLFEKKHLKPSEILPCLR